MSSLLPFITGLPNEPNDWRRWFAWRPVRCLVDGKPQTTWLRMIERKKELIYGSEPGVYSWAYARFRLVGDTSDGDYQSFQSDFDFRTPFGLTLWIMAAVFVSVIVSFAFLR